MNGKNTHRPVVWSVPGLGVKWPVKPTARLYVMPEAKDVRSYSSTLRISKGVGFDLAQVEINFSTYRSGGTRWLSSLRQ